MATRQGCKEADGELWELCRAYLECDLQEAGWHDVGGGDVEARQRDGVKGRSKVSSIQK